MRLGYRVADIAVHACAATGELAQLGTIEFIDVAKAQGNTIILDCPLLGRALFRHIGSSPYVPT
jgi:hypothetical protein